MLGHLHPGAALIGLLSVGLLLSTRTELVFDLGFGDIFSIRIAGNVISQKVLGSMEYGCAVAGAKLIVVIGHTQCGAITAAVNITGSSVDAEQATGCQQRPAHRGMHFTAKSHHPTTGRGEEDRSRW